MNLDRTSLSFALTALVACLVGCGVSVAPNPSGAHCTGTAPECVDGNPATGVCGDFSTQATCVDDAWTCSTGQIPSSACHCFGGIDRPGCTCTASGWACATGDGGTDGGPDAGCAGTGFLCISGAGHICSDTGESASCVAGAWTCPPSTIPESECWCSDFDGPHAGCTCERGGWVCASTDGGVIEPSERFACGPSNVCNAGMQVCVHRHLGDDPDDSWSCIVAPAACTPATCDCVEATIAGACSEVDGGGIVVDQVGI